MGKHLKKSLYTSFSCNLICSRENWRGRPDSTTLLTGWWTSIRSTLQHNSAGHVRLNNERSAQKTWEARLIPRDGDGYISSCHMKKNKRCKLEWFVGRGYRWQKLNSLPSHPWSYSSAVKNSKISCRIWNETFNVANWLQPLGHVPVLWNIAEGCPHQYLYKYAPLIGMKTDIIKLWYFKEQDCLSHLVSGNRSQ